METHLARMKVVTFQPLRRGWYRVWVDNEPTKQRVKQGSVRSTRTRIENEGRRPPPKPIGVELREVATHYLPNYVECPRCHAERIYFDFGRVRCMACSKPFTIIRSKSF